MLEQMDWARLESPAYWVVTVVVFLGVALWESARSDRPLTETAERRWTMHAAVFAISAALLGLLLRVAPVYYAESVVGSSPGLLARQWMPSYVRFAAALVALDFVHYATHRLFHAVGFLWRIHEVHHSDRDFDVSTSIRFHPVEVVLSQAVMLGAIRLLSPPPAAVLTAVLLTAAENLFVHANCALPRRVENVLRLLIITPDAHRLHHSINPLDHNRNFGQLLPWWDRLFGTWRMLPQGGSIVTGVEGVRDRDTLRIGYLLTGPFRRRR